MIDYVRSHAPGFIFTAALPQAIMDATSTGDAKGDDGGFEWGLSPAVPSGPSQQHALA